MANRVVYLAAGLALALAGAVLFQSRKEENAGRSRRPRPPVDELAESLKGAWAGHHNP